MKNRTTTWKMIDYTDQEKSNHYRILLDALHHYETKKRITEDWMEEHKKMILIMRDYYTNISLANIDLQDKTFRSLADDSEMLLCHLVYEIKETRTFTVEIYYNLCRNLKRMFEIALQMEDLSDLFTKSLNF